MISSASIELLVRIALGQHAKQRAEIVDAGKRKTAGDQPTRPQAQGLHGIGAEMFIEPRAPDDLKGIAGLQQALKAGRAAAAHKAEMSAMRPREQFDDDGSLAMPPDASDEALVAPFQCSVPQFPAMRWGGGIFARRSAIRTVQPASAPTSAATPGQPAREKNTPPTEPATLDPR